MKRHFPMKWVYFQGIEKKWVKFRFWDFSKKCFSYFLTFLASIHDPNCNYSWITISFSNNRPSLISGPTQYLIHEEGGLERWFNLTITNVGLEAVADYTCVAVNAGGVMEEAITLTFEEPEPVCI